MPKKNTDKAAEQAAELNIEQADELNIEQADENAVADGILRDTEQKVVTPEYEIVNIPPANPGEEEVLVLYVNGHSYVMDKGNSYRLPKAVAAEYHRSVKAAHRATKRKSELRKKEQAINAHTDAVIAGKA